VHSLAAYYPEAPTEEERAAALGLVAALRLLYPCDHCRAAFAAALEEDPPDASSGRALAAWAWRQHNAVNAALGKPAFPLEALQARWRSGCRDAVSGQQRLQ
jgi:FAD-linked sulfhydryl oxidase